MSDTEKTKHINVYRCKEIIHDILIQTGQKDQLMCHIRHKSIHHGWLWAMRREFMEYIKKRGANNVNVSHMIEDLAPIGKRLFPPEVRNELLECLQEVVQDYFIVDDNIPPFSDENTENADKTFFFQSHDVKPDPGLGVGVEVPDSPPPSPPSDNSAGSSPVRSPSSSANVSSAAPPPRQSPARQSPGPAPKSSPIISSSVQKCATPQPPPPPPPPVLRPESVSTKTEIVKKDVNEEEHEDEEEEGNNEDDDEDELMDI